MKNFPVNKYDSDFSAEFDKDYKKIKSNFELKRRLENKIEEIIENPHHYKPLRNVLKNRRRTQIGSDVLIFEVKEEERVVVFHSFKHHDSAYKK